MFKTSYNPLNIGTSGFGDMPKIKMQKSKIVVGALHKSVPLRDPINTTPYRVWLFCEPRPG